MIDLIRTCRLWADGEMREYTENFIGQILKRGDQWLMARVNQAEAQGLLPDGFDTSGADAFRDLKYMPRSLAAGLVGDELKERNEKLKKLIALQGALIEFRRLSVLLEGDNALPSQIEDEDGQLVDNPALLAAAVQFGDVLALIDAASIDEWRLVAQRLAGAEIADPLEQNLAVIRMLPTIELLESFVEGEGLGSIDKRYNVETERQRMIDELTPAEEAAGDVVV